MDKFSQKPPRDIYLLYQDSDIVVVSKPEWLLSVPGRGEDKQDSVVSRVQQIHPQALTVHRLDWATSGIMIMALNKEAQRILNKQFEFRQTQKRYIAAVEGIVNLDSQVINMPLRCDWEKRPRQITDFEQGKPSKTKIIVLNRERKKQRTTLALHPITGRSHQLRVHCQNIGHAIVGDQLYAKSKNKINEPRMLLHAEWLQVKHPKNNQLIEFYDACPFT